VRVVVWEEVQKENANAGIARRDNIDRLTSPNTACVVKRVDQVNRSIQVIVLGECL